MPGAIIQQSDPDSSATDSFTFEPSSWVSRFRSHTSRTRFVHLPSDFLSSVLTGAVYTSPLPPGEAATQTEIEWSDGTVDVVQAESPAPDAFGIEAEIERRIAELGGAVCPKFGPTCPVDATWANFHRSTKCTSADDVLTLLKSSERVMAAAVPGRGTALALRKWADLDDRMEFRCFVRDDVLVAVCQRLVENTTEYADEDMDRIVRQIARWFERRVVDVFEGPRRYVLDVYIDRGSAVWIIDFGRWGEPTDALLFAWEELEHASWMESQNRAQFRCAYRHAAIRPSRRIYDGLPLELRSPETMASLAEAAQRLVTEEGNGDSDDSELDSR